LREGIVDLEDFGIEQFGIVLDEKIAVVVGEAFEDPVFGDADPFVGLGEEQGDRVAFAVGDRFGIHTVQTDEKIVVGVVAREADIVPDEGTYQCGTVVGGDTDETLHGLPFEFSKQNGKFPIFYSKQA
jgi:hypothetical protein